MNILTFDIEEWFHLLDCDATRTENEWKNYEVRIYDNMERIFSILEETNTNATFFIVGWIAKTYPDLVRRIADKYQIGCHTMNHQLVWQQSPQEFKADVELGIKTLEDISGCMVECFRAPGFSIRQSEAWAFEILADLGIKYDCSLFPSSHAHGGMPSLFNHSTIRPQPCIIDYHGIHIKEFPVNHSNINIIFSGGGYFRLFPYPLLKKLSANSADYLLAYIHPRDLDANQPVIKSLPLSRKFKSYVGLRSAEQKLRQWLSDFRFVDIATANHSIDWTSVPKLKFE